MVQKQKYFLANLLVVSTTTYVLELNCTGGLGCSLIHIT